MCMEKHDPSHAKNFLDGALGSIPASNTKEGKEITFYEVELAFGLCDFSTADSLFAYSLSLRLELTSWTFLTQLDWNFAAWCVYTQRGRATFARSWNPLKIRRKRSLNTGRFLYFKSFGLGFELNNRNSGIKRGRLPQRSIPRASRWFM